MSYRANVSPLLLVFSCATARIYCYLFAMNLFKQITLKTINIKNHFMTTQYNSKTTVIIVLISSCIIHHEGYKKQKINKT